MSKKLTYEQLNPGVILTEGTDIIGTIPMTVYNADGSTYKFPKPTVGEIAALSRKMLEAVPGVEMRKLLMAVEHLDRITENATLQTLATLHNIIHDAEVTEGLSQLSLHEGLMNYLDENEVTYIPPVPEGQMTPEEINARLATFFTHDKKPN